MLLSCKTQAICHDESRHPISKNVATRHESNKTKVYYKYILTPTVKYYYNNIDPTDVEYEYWPSYNGYQRCVWLLKIYNKDIFLYIILLFIVFFLNKLHFDK